MRIITRELLPFGDVQQGLRAHIQRCERCRCAVREDYNTFCPDGNLFFLWIYKPDKPHEMPRDLQEGDVIWNRGYGIMQVLRVDFGQVYLQEMFPQDPKKQLFAMVMQTWLYELDCPYQYLGRGIIEPPPPPTREEKLGEFREKLTTLINSISMENGSNTPDAILAKYLTSCLDAFDTATTARDTWYGRVQHPCSTPTEAPESC